MSGKERVWLIPRGGLRHDLVMTIRVVIVDDHAMIRSGLRALLDAQDDIEVVGEAEDGDAAIVAAAKLHPDVMLMDVRMPRVNGLEATRQIMSSDEKVSLPRVLMLTTFDIDEYVYEALRVGASGFLLKDVPTAQLVQAVRSVAAGESLLAPSATRRLIERFVALDNPPPDARLSVLTERELEVLKAIARGFSNAEIAESLFISVETVKTHVGSILRKLGLRDRVQAVVIAYECRLL